MKCADGETYPDFLHTLRELTLAFCIFGGEHCGGVFGLGFFDFYEDGVARVELFVAVGRGLAFLAALVLSLAVGFRAFVRVPEVGEAAEGVGIEGFEFGKVGLH